MAEQPFSAMLQTNKCPPPHKLKNSERREERILVTSRGEATDRSRQDKKLGCHSHRDAVLIMMAYRHALRVGELVNLRWDQVNFSEGKLHVNRLKHGDASIHYLEGDEMRALRKLQRDYPDSPYLFCIYFVLKEKDRFLAARLITS
jgi:type 1 fimbriae regulatory protein FimB/type 1 fimbriae regulatory protein FimE